MIDVNPNTIIQNLVRDIQKKESEIFETALRVFAEPQIKGEITKGKLKWRGIKIIQHNEGMKITKWMEQRGVCISPKIIHEPQIQMKLPIFQATKTDDNRFKLVSDQGHSHYKEAIEMLLQSEMFIKHNAHLLYIYCVGLSMMDDGNTGKITPNYELPGEFSMQDWVKYFIDYSDSMKKLHDSVVEYSCGERHETNKAKLARFNAIIDLAKKVFPETTQTN